MTRNLKILFISLIIGFISIDYFLVLSQRSYWKDRCFEIQENYEAISKENSDLQDTVVALKAIIRSQTIY